MKITLSPRELEALRLLSGGHSHKVVADAMGISMHTLGEHMKNVHIKLDVSTLVEAVVIAVRQNII